MAIGLVTSLRTTMATDIITAIDAGGAAGSITFYNGTQPATGDAATTALAVLPLSYPCGVSAAGVLTFSAITSDNSADATGTATWARIQTSASVFVIDMTATVTGGGGDVTLGSVSISTGQQVSVTSAAITIGGA